MVDIERVSAMSISSQATLQSAPRSATFRAFLEPGEDRLLARIAIDKAKAGDAVALRFVVGRLYPRPRGRAIVLDLPPDMRQGNVVAVFDAILRAMAAGEITPEEARAVTLVLDGRLRVLEAWERELRLERVQRFAAGGLLYPEAPVFDWHPDDEKDLPEPPGFAAAWRQHEAEWAEYEVKRAEVEARGAVPDSRKVDAPSPPGHGVSPANHLRPQASPTPPGDTATAKGEAGDSGDHLHSACICTSRPGPTRDFTAGVEGPG
jgi:hypothetical protein